MLTSAAERKVGVLGGSKKGTRGLVPACPYLLLGILGKRGQTGFAGSTAVVGRDSHLLQLAPLRVEKSYSFGASHIVPARVGDKGCQSSRRVDGLRAD